MRTATVSVSFTLSSATAIVIIIIIIIIIIVVVVVVITLRRVLSLCYKIAFSFVAVVADTGKKFNVFAASNQACIKRGAILGTNGDDL